MLRGAVHHVTHPLPGLPVDDVTLVDKIKSEVLGRDPFAHWRITLDAVGGRVSLRGEIPDASQAATLEHEVRRVAGVVEVVNYLHVPGTLGRSGLRGNSAATYRALWRTS